MFDATVLATSLEALTGEYEGVAVVALDHPAVRAAISDLVEGGAKVVTLVSDVPSSRRHHYIGIDNIAAGRTAGALVGRLVGPRSGKIAIVAGSQGLRDHAERIFGFSQVMASEFSQLDVLPVLEGRDEDERSEELLTKLLGKHSAHCRPLQCRRRHIRASREALTESGRDKKNRVRRPRRHRTDAKIAAAGGDGRGDLAEPGT